MQNIHSIEEMKHQFEQLATFLPIAVALFDLDMCYLFANQRWIEDYHLDGQEIINRSHYEVFPEIVEEWKNIHQQCLQGHVHKDEAVFFQRMDGSSEWISREIRPWTYQDGRIGGIIIYSEVITHRKQTEEALQQQHRFLLQVMDLNTSFVFAKDRDGYFTLVNQALAEAYGSSIEDMVGKSDKDFNPDVEQVGNIRRDDLEVLHTRQPKFIAEEPVTHAKGTTRWYQTTKVPLISENAQDVQLLGIATDITERKQVQDTLRKQSRFLRQVIDLDTSFVFAKDTDGNYTLVNQALADAYGSTPDKMVGTSDKDYNPDTKQAEKIRRDDLEVIHRRQPKFNFEEAVTHANGQTRWYQTTKIPLISDDGAEVQLLGIATDITERKQAQEQLEKLVVQEQEARQAAEAASEFKDLFLANMSHELRTPLNAIIGFVREMLYSQQLDADNTHMAERSLANGKRLAMLINSVLDLSRLAVGSLELVVTPVDLPYLAQIIREDLSIQAKEKGLEFKLTVDESLPQSILHDEERLTQIMSNLLVNAIKYTESGYVELALRRKDADHFIIQVSDTGIGIPSDLHTYIFENFVQVNDDKRDEGVGLGLSIVKNLVDLMGGLVTLRSEINAYSTFTVELPLNLPS